MIGSLSDPPKPTKRFRRMPEVGERQREVRQRLMEFPESSPDDARLGGLRGCDPFPEGDNHSLPIMRAGINDTCRRNDRPAPCRHVRRDSDGFAHAKPRFSHPRDDSADLNDGRQHASAENSPFARRKRMLTSNSDRKSDPVLHHVKVIDPLGAAEGSCRHLAPCPRAIRPPTSRRRGHRQVDRLHRPRSRKGIPPRLRASPAHAGRAGSCRLPRPPVCTRSRAASHG